MLPRRPSLGWRGGGDTLNPTQEDTVTEKKPETAEQAAARLQAERQAGNPDYVKPKTKKPAA